MKIRLYLAYTVMSPLWIILSLPYLFIWMITGSFLMAPVFCIYSLIRYYFANGRDKIEYKTDINDGLIMSFLPFTSMYFIASKFIQEGKIDV